jgi:PBSX family phage terminase large subunit
MTARVKFKEFSAKQLKVLRWWLPSSPYRDCDGIICDGAVRSGKTVCMSVSFISWAMLTFNGCSFAVCGKTVASARRNIVTPLLPLLSSLGFACEEKVSKNTVEISAFGNRNRFYLFGGRDESSASLIQGMTLSGVMLDEVVLMPRSFVEQAVARCSPDGAKLWFNCNPGHPLHWFHEEWIKKHKEKNCLYLHFVMSDNPSLSPSTLERYERLYTGVFRDRYILGKWVAARDTVYPMFSPERHVVKAPENFEKYYISCDYGTVNPSSFGLWGKNNGVWYRIAEYYYDSKVTGVRRTDGEHYEALKRLAGVRKIEAVTVDPSAASFIETVTRDGKFRVIPAKNDVLDGIRRVQEALREGKILIGEDCADTIREFSLYRWDENALRDSVIKENDHAMDDIRYFVSTVLCREDGGEFFAVFPKRQ